MIRAVLAVAVLSAAGAGGATAARHLLPRDGMVARGLVVDGVAVATGEPIDQVVERCVERRLNHRVDLVYQGRVVMSPDLRALDATIDARALRRRLTAIGRTGSWWRRLDESLEARRGRLAVHAATLVPIHRLVRALERFKLERDRPPQPARWDFAADQVTPHRDGMLIDLYATAEALQRAARDGEARVAIATRPVVPRATTEVVSRIDRSQVLSTYETRYAYLGDQAGRAQNIRRASRAVDGLVLMPGELVSFNEIVGPRSLANGFAQAGEIYKGEMRIGVGGGTCQVASTLYCAAFFAALEVVERSPHSRPSGYVPLGLDATVAYPHVDLRLRNPHDFPVVVRAHIEPGVLTFELLGKARPADVDYQADTIRVSPYKRKVREAGWLAEGKIVRKQKGIRGLTVRKLRRIRLANGQVREEKTTDVYPPTDEIYLVAPGTDLEAALPPLPEGVDLDYEGQGRARAKPRADEQPADEEGSTYPGEDEGFG